MIDFETFKKKFTVVPLVVLKAGSETLSEVQVAFGGAEKKAFDLLATLKDETTNALLEGLLKEKDTEMDIDTGTLIVLRVSAKRRGLIRRLAKKKDTRELLLSMYGIGRGATAANNPLILKEDERKLFLNRFNHYLKYYELRTPLEIDTLAIACWNFVKMITEMNISEAEPTKPLTNLRTFTNAYISLLKALGITYLPTKREGTTAVGDDIDIGKLILDAAENSFEAEDKKDGPSKLDLIKKKRKEREESADTN